MTAPYPLSFAHVGVTSLAPEELSEVEKRWVSFQPYLLAKGYQLRPRYRPGWIPSWKSTGAEPFLCEDGGNSLPVRTLDATRLTDDLQVVIKMIIPTEDDREGEEELEIVRHLSSEQYLADSTNHTVPCLDSFPMPGVERGVFYVMPLLRDYNDPPFYNLGEIHDFLVQIFEGLQFLHKNNIAHWHSDIASSNIMMDGRVLYHQPFHPFHQDFTLDRKRQIHPRYLRSQRPVRYYYIDFGYAKWFRDSSQPHVLRGSRARERAPEQLSGELYNPFLADIYQLGALLRRDLIPSYPVLQFLLHLAREMTEHDPNERPTLEQASRIMTTHFAGLTGWRTRWPIVPRDASYRQKWMSIVAGVTGEVALFLSRVMRLLFFRGH